MSVEQGSADVRAIEQSSDVRDIEPLVHDSALFTPRGQKYRVTITYEYEIAAWSREQAQREALDVHEGDVFGRLIDIEEIGT
jgi:hypothetical protein